MTGSESTFRPLVPLVVGIVGHRDLREDDLDVLRGAIEKQLMLLHRAYPNTPTVLLSSLAEGADQLAVDAALKCGFRVRAALPMPAEWFRRSSSFSSNAARIHFDKLLRECTDSFVVPLPPGEEPATPAEWKAIARDTNSPHRELRHQCYANAGAFVARRCDVVLALWDGQDPDPSKPSGTAEVVYFKLLGRPPALYPWKHSEPLGYRGDRGPVIVLHAPRTGATASAVTQGLRVGAPTVYLPSELKRPGAKLGDVALAQRTRLATRLRRWCRETLWRRRSGDEVALELQQFQETCTAIDDFNRDVQCKDRGLDERLSGARDSLAKI